MEEKEPDFSSLNKYFISDELKKPEPVKVNTIIEDVSIRESSFVSYENTEKEDEILTSEIKQKIEKKGNPDKIKFLQRLSDDDNSLTIDTCNSVSKDWKRK